MKTISDGALKRIINAVTAQMNTEYSDEQTEAELNGKIAACVYFMLNAGVAARLLESKAVDPRIIQLIIIMLLDLSEETPGLTKFSPAAQFILLQLKLGADGDGNG